MPLITEGVYVRCDDSNYEAETTYYLNFQILSALASLDRLNNYDDRFLWENRCQYYHYYCDHLLYSIGQISNRFIINPNEKDRLLKERKQLNRANYQFSETNYPILSDKNARNTIEHIDEHNQNIISKKHGVGGFNLIDSETDMVLIKELRSRRETHIYTLDLLKKELLIHRKGKDITISLESLHNELLQLQNNVKAFQCLVSNY